MRYPVAIAAICAGLYTGLAGCATAVISQTPLAETEAVEEETIVTTTEQTRRGPVAPAVSFRYLIAMAQSSDPAVRQRGYENFRIRVRAGQLTAGERETLNRLFGVKGFAPVR